MERSLLSMAKDGISLAQGIVPRARIEAVHDSLLDVARFLGVPKEAATTIDSAWNWLCHTDRATAGLLYNAFKRLAAVHQLACAPELLQVLRHEAGIECPMLVDINCRIDAFAGDKYLFGWHQDYWFSICSPNAVVMWMPLTDVTADNGGLDVISNRWTAGRIFRSKPGSKYDSYADAVQLDEAIPDENAIRIMPRASDALLFRFSVLHRSAPVLAPDRSRFTVQLRFADATDTDFRNNLYKPGVVTHSNVEYLAQSGPELGK
jgi:hypothetical protein